MTFREDLDRLRDYTRKRPAILNALRDMTEDGIKAASYETDRTTGHSTRLWCWDHQNDPHDCHKAGFLCDGDPIPSATDITGETAIRGDRARRTTAELSVAEQRIAQAAANVYDLAPTLTINRAKQVLAVYLEDPVRRLPNTEKVVASAVGTLHRISSEMFCNQCTRPQVHPCPKHTALSETDIAKDRESLGAATPEHWCSFCGDEPPCTKNPTTVNGNLPHPRTVGRQCYDYIRTRGKPPTRQDLDHLTRTGKWPKMRETAA